MRIVNFGVLLTALATVGLFGCEGEDAEPNGGGTVIIIPEQPEPEAQPEAQPEPQPEAQPEAQPEPQPEAEPQPTCGGGSFEAVSEVIDVQAFGPRYLALDGESGTVDALFIEFHEDRGPIEPGTYDLAGTNFADCSVCVVAARNCDLQNGGCEKIFYPKAGTIELTGYGEPGEMLVAGLFGIDLAEANLSQAGSEFVDGGDTWCIENHEVAGEITPPPARLGEPVRDDFELQNCESGEFVNMRTLAGEKNGLWMVATAGWCSACRQFVPQVISNLPQIDNNIEVVFVLGENVVYGQPNIDYCKRYAQHYEVEDASRFYIDHSGTRSFATTFEYVWPYLGANGEFGLPWNGMIRNEGGEWLYHYSDRSGDGRDLNAAINELMR